MPADGRYIELVFRGDARSVLRAYSQVSEGAVATGRKVETAFDRSQRALGRTASAAHAVGRVMTGVGLGLAAVGYSAVKTAATFEQSMTRVQTQAGASAGEVDNMTKKIQAYVQAGKSAATPSELAQGLFYFESVGLRSTRAFKALTLAQDASAMSGAALTDVSSAFSSAIVASRTPLSGYTRLMAEMNATVGAGKLHFQDLTDALGHGMIPSFQAVGLTSRDALASIAVLTRMGFPAAGVGAQLPTALHFLSHPGTAAAKVLAQIGIAPGQLAADFYKPKGLLVALSDLRSHLAGLSKIQQSQVLQSILPGGRGRIMLALIQGLDQYGKMLDQIQGRTAQWGKGIAATHKTTADKLHTAWSQIQGSMISLGQALTPLVVQILPGIVKAVKAISSAFADLPRWAKTGFGYVVVALAVGGPVMLALARVLSAVKAIRAMFITLRAASATAGGAMALSLGAVRTAASLLLGTLQKIAAIYAVLKVGQGVKGDVQRTVRAIKTGGITGKHGLVQEQIHSFQSGEGGSGYLPRVFPGPTSGGGLKSLLPWNWFARGGIVPGYASGGGIPTPWLTHPNGTDTVPAWLTPGEGVLTRAAMAGIGTSGLNAMNAGGGLGGAGLTIQPAPVYIVLDGRIVAKSVLRQVLRTAARGPSGLTGGSLVTGTSVAVNRGFG